MLKSDNGHRFPSFSGEPSSASHENGEDNVFRPLFQNRPVQYSPTLPSQSNTKPDIDPQEKERVCRLGFERGMADGIKDACQLAKESIEPELVDFLQAFENVSAFHHQLTETTSSQIVGMALKICEQIVSSPINISEKQKGAILKELSDIISENHRIEVCFHDEDLRAIKELMACFDLPWPASEAVDVRSAKLSRRGEMESKTAPPQKDIGIETIMTNAPPSPTT